MLPWLLSYQPIANELSAVYARCRCYCLSFQFGFKWSRQIRRERRWNFGKNKPQWKENPSSKAPGLWSSCQPDCSDNGTKKCWGVLKRNKSCEMCVWFGYFIDICIINRTLHVRLEIRFYLLVLIISLTSERDQHSAIKFVSPRGHVMSSISTLSNSSKHDSQCLTVLQVSSRQSLVSYRHSH